MLLDKHGNIIDGRHRLAADEDWPKMKLEHVETEEDGLVARLISNVCRRDVSAGEKSEMPGKLGEIYLSEGLKPGKIAYKIGEETGMSYRWVMQYLPDKLNERPDLGGPSKALKFDKKKKKHGKVKLHISQLKTTSFCFQIRKKKC